MPDVILLEGDTVSFLPSFGAAVVVPQPGTLQGSGPATVNGKKVCVEGDESKVSVAGCTYITPQFSIKAQKTATGGKAVLLKGKQFTAKFEVQSPAKQPTQAGPVPDPTPQYSGSGMFISTNTIFNGT
ncbi:MAG: hypothetical protein L6Q76_35200 [Polyangiaceae bacterium]|nr:hypothetical protein [Polyangiaceae bacterium]